MNLLQEHVLHFVRIQDVWSNYSSMPCTSDASLKRTESRNQEKEKKTLSKFNKIFIAGIIFGSWLNTKSSKADELREYGKEELEPSDCNPDDVFLYLAWKSHKWPRMSLARDFLSIHREKQAFFFFTAAAVCVNFGMKIKELGSCCIAPIRLCLMPEEMYARPLRRKGKDDGKQVSGCFGQNTLDI